MRESPFMDAHQLTAEPKPQGHSFGQHYPSSSASMPNLYILSTRAKSIFQLFLENIRMETAWDRVALFCLFQVHCQCIIIHL